MVRRRAKRGGLYIALFFVLAALPLLCVFPYIAATNNPNENVRTYMTMAIVERGTLQLDDYVTRYGYVNDMAQYPKSGPAHFYSVKAPAVSFAAVPVYWSFLKIAPRIGIEVPDDKTATPTKRVDWFRSTTWALRIVVVQIPCFVFLIFLERWLRAVTSDTVIRLSAVAAAGLGTNYVAYTNIFASHALCGAAAFSGFALVERERRRSMRDPRARRWWIALLAGFFISATVLLEYHVIGLAMVLALYGLATFWRPRTLVPYALGAAVNAGLLMLFQWKAFGDPLTPGHKYVTSPEFAAQHAQGLFGIVTPDPEALAALSFDRGFGFFGTSPYMLLGLLAIPLGLMLTYGGPMERSARRSALFVCVLAMGALWAVSGGFLHWRGGWTIGPRYLAAAPPFFAYGSACALEWIARRSPPWRVVARGIAGGLAIASVLSIGLVGLVYDTLPETYTRPLVQFALPMIRGGYVPHHVGEWFGWDSTTFWYVCAAALVLAPVLVALMFDREPPLRYLVRTSVVVVAFAIGMSPALSPLTEQEIKAGAIPEPDNRGLMFGWEPAGRDRITLARIEAERRGPRGPCYWYRLADIERSVGLVAEATQDERRATAPRTACERKRIF